MITDLELSILEKALATILKHPADVTRNDFNDVYNCVYLHCSSKSENYLIKGEDIYNQLEKALDNFSNRIEFIASCDVLCEQIALFQQSEDILVKIFSYLERFYIKTSILNSTGVKKIKDLFYYKIYYNFIYKAEENLLNVIFLEIETLRKFHKMEIIHLKTVIRFYLESLARNGLETNMNQFYKKYMAEFKTSFDFNCSIRQLVKKVHMEVFISTNVFIDYEITKKIIQFIMGRKDEIMKYAFHKIEKFEKLKHIYAIISKMPESGRLEFKQRYDTFLTDLFTKSTTFESLYGSYCNVNQQIKLNKMTGFVELIDECMSKTFKERSSNDQADIFDAIIRYVEKNFGEKVNKSLNIQEKCTNLDDQEMLFNFFATIVDDRLIDKYIASVQLRLINGTDPSNEQFYMNLILERIGLGAISRLKNSISSFLDKSEFECIINEKTGKFTASLIKITKGFWNVEKNEVNLHPTLEKIKAMLYEKSGIQEKQKIEFNFSISPVIFELNGTTYKVSTDAFSIYFSILENAEDSDKNLMKSMSSDKNFDKNIAILENAGLILCVGEIGDKSLYTAVNKKSDLTFCDLFSKEDCEITKKVVKNHIENKNHIIESMICRLMKKRKFLSRDLLYSETGLDVEEAESAVRNLISKGYLEIVNDAIHYIP